MSIRQSAYPETETEIKTSHFKFKKLKKNKEEVWQKPHWKIQLYIILIEKED
jgi:hypothetical protein